MCPCFRYNAETFEQAESGASLTYPQQAGTIRKNAYIVINGHPCKVRPWQQLENRRHPAESAQQMTREARELGSSRARRFTLEPGAQLSAVACVPAHQATR